MSKKTPQLYTVVKEYTEGNDASVKQQDVVLSGKFFFFKTKGLEILQDEARSSLIDIIDISDIPVELKSVQQWIKDNKAVGTGDMEIDDPNVARGKISVLYLTEKIYEDIKFIWMLGSAPFFEKIISHVPTLPDLVLGLFNFYSVFRPHLQAYRTVDKEESEYNEKFEELTMPLFAFVACSLTDTPAPADKDKLKIAGETSMKTIKDQSQGEKKFTVADLEFLAHLFIISMKKRFTSTEALAGFIERRASTFYSTYHLENSINITKKDGKVVIEGTQLTTVLSALNKWAVICSTRPMLVYRIYKFVCEQSAFSSIFVLARTLMMETELTSIMYAYRFINDEELTAAHLEDDIARLSVELYEEFQDMSKKMKGELPYLRFYPIHKDKLIASKYTKLVEIALLYYEYIKKEDTLAQFARSRTPNTIWMEKLKKKVKVSTSDKQGSHTRKYLELRGLTVVDSEKASDGGLANIAEALKALIEKAK